MPSRNAPIHALADPVFILGCHKSGTSLTRSLLDGTPGLFVAPKEPHYFSYTGWPVRYPLRRRNRASAPKAHLRDCLERDNADTNPYSDLPAFSGWDIATFMSAVGDDLSYDSYATAVQLALGHEPGQERFVDKSTDSLEFADVLARWFPGGHFVHVIRNPYANLCSIRRYLAKRSGNYPRMWDPVQTVRMSAEIAEANTADLGDAYLVIKYEDLVLATEKTMHRIAAHIGVHFAESMLTPTVLGLPWRGNSTSHDVLQGVSTMPLDEWRTDVSAYERALVARSLGIYFDQFGYERLPSVSIARSLRRRKAESFRSYVANRALLAR